MTDCELPSPWSLQVFRLSKAKWMICPEESPIKVIKCLLQLEEPLITVTLITGSSFTLQFTTQAHYWLNRNMGGVIMTSTTVVTHLEEVALMVSFAVLSFWYILKL